MLINLKSQTFKYRDPDSISCELKLVIKMANLLTD